MKKNNKKGFTLVELVIVVAVMAILVAVAIPTVSSITQSADKAVDASNARTIESIIKLEEAKQSNSNNSSTGLSTTQIDAALTAAKLGIETGTFEYDATTGAVKEGAAATGKIEIVFNISATDSNDIVKVTQK